MTEKPSVLRKPALWSAVVLVLGIVTAILLVRLVPPAPAFSPELGRVTFYQSFENSYFATIRSYEALVREALDQGEIPVVVFGDSTIRGVGAAGDSVWSRVLEARLRERSPKVRVLNFAQNSGDQMGLFLYHHLQSKFPQAYYVVQWHFGRGVGARTPFYYWLTSEIVLRDGKKNPAVRQSLEGSAILKKEWLSFFMAGFNILTNYLDVGNWVRYRWLGILDYRRVQLVKLFPDWKDVPPGFRKVRIPTLSVVPLEKAPDRDVSLEAFQPPDEVMQKTLRDLFVTSLAGREKYIDRPFAERAAYLDALFPPAVRDHLLLVSLDMNPYFSPREDARKMELWRSEWARLRQDMPALKGLNWFSLTAADGKLEPGDYVDLAHLNAPGQRKFGNALADHLLDKMDWFGGSREAIAP